MAVKPARCWYVLRARFSPTIERVYWSPGVGGGLPEEQSSAVRFTSKGSAEGCLIYAHMRAPFLNWRIVRVVRRVVAETGLDNSYAGAYARGATDARASIIVDINKLHRGADILALTDTECVHGERLLRLLSTRYAERKDGGP